MRIISLGWGVQSFGLAAMSALGALPKVDYAIHADTSWERAETYAFATKWTPWLEARGVKVITVQAEKERLSVVCSVNVPSVLIPAFTLSLSDNSQGQLTRQCTQEWKIRPIRRWLSLTLADLGLTKIPGVIEQWIGFTLDEAHRVSPDRVQYVKKEHPYLEMLDRPYTRRMVIRWLREHDLEVPVKSSCVCCPYRRDYQWREMQLAENGDWEKAVAVDRAIRNKRPGYECFLCDDRKALEAHDFTKQLSLW